MDLDFWDYFRRKKLCPLSEEIRYLMRNVGQFSCFTITNAIVPQEDHFIKVP